MGCRGFLTSFFYQRREGVPIEIWGPENGFDAVYEDVPAALKDLTVV